MQYYFSPYKQTMFFIVFCLLALLSPPCFAENTPKDAIKSFYQLVSKQQCTEAIKIRPDYTVERCEKITKVHIHKVTTELGDHKNAVVLLELDSFLNKKKSYFFGYVKLTNKKNKWLIIGPFKNREDYWLDEYVKTYIPEGIKRLSATEKKEKITAPPVKKLSTKQVPTPIEEKTTQQKNIKLSKPLTKKESKAIPPGDSIDADEFKEPSVSPQQAYTKKVTPNNISNNSVNTKTSKSTTPEADKFIFGEHPIEGNYTFLLKGIRKHFPTEATSNILLIDQSRNTIYIYNNTDSLLAFFPILSSDNFNFPSGLYKLKANSSIDLNNQRIQIHNQAITLERIQNTIPTEHNAPLKHKKEQYYIRDLFDTDKSKSLQLSPIDNNKLQQLVLPSTMAYKGQ